MEAQTISLVFFTRKNIRTQQVAKQVLELFFTLGSEFAPESFDSGGKWKVVDKVVMGTVLKKWNSSNNFLMRRERPYQSEIAVSMGFFAFGFNTISIWVDQKYFQVDTNVSTFLNFSNAIYDLIQPTYGSIHQTEDAIKMLTVQDSHYGQTVVPIDLNKGLPTIYWANYFGPEYVEIMNRAKLLSTPCEEKRELSDRGVVLITSPSPLLIDHKRQEHIKAHLGKDLFFTWGQS